MTEAEMRMELMVGFLICLFGLFALFFLLYIPNKLMNDIPQCLCSGDFRLTDIQVVYLNQATNFTLEELGAYCEGKNKNLTEGDVRRCLCKFNDTDCQLR